MNLARPVFKDAGLPEVGDGGTLDHSPPAERGRLQERRAWSPIPDSRQGEVASPSRHRSPAPCVLDTQVVGDQQGDSVAGDAVAGKGLLSREVFSRYDVDKNGKLGIAEFVFLLRDNGVAMDYSRACRMIDYSKGLDFETFLGLLASSLQETKMPREDAMAVPRSVFNSYDVNKSGMLERTEYLNLLVDHGHALDTLHDPEALEVQLGDCRQGSAFAPFGLERFLALMCRLSHEKLSEP